jgi:hypothetical protein
MQLSQFETVVGVVTVCLIFRRFNLFKFNIVAEAGMRFAI